jgi:hypothetical protein
MSAHKLEPFGQQPQATALQRTANDANTFESQEPQHGSGQDEHVLVHFNGHFNGQFNGAFLVPNTTYQSASADNDAQIAARRAMKKRSSRSFGSKMARTRSRKMEAAKKTTKPGITVDTSFARHRGNAPHQMYPQESEVKSGGSIRKPGWFGLGRSGTKTKGLGITKGTPQPEAPSGRRLPPHGDFSDMNDPKTADSLTAGSKSWNEISPWDRPIPIGISIPSDSVTDFSPYRGTRGRSDSDATLATPSIIITPAAAIKSVWSPDTDSDYTPARASSIYSRATFYPHTSKSDVPPVPALPADAGKQSGKMSGDTLHRGSDGPFASRTRSDTVDSDGTAFEEENEMKRKDRIMSTGTVFEEDDTPLRDNNSHSTLAVDTTTTPTSRRSQGWWNIITTPFVVSPINSIWTQRGPPLTKVSGVPTMSVGQQSRDGSPVTASTYIWSATERSPSVHGGSPLAPLPVKADSSTHQAYSQANSGEVTKEVVLKTPPAAIKKENKDHTPAVNGVADKASKNSTNPTSQTQTVDANMASPLSALSATPEVGTATIGTILMPRHVENPLEPERLTVNIELQDRQPPVPAQKTATSAPRTNLKIYIPSPDVERFPPKLQKSQQAVPVFPPPPTSVKKGPHSSYRNDSRASSPVSTAELKGKKNHHAAGNMMAKLALCRRKKDVKKPDKKQKKKRTRCIWCCGACTVIIVLLLIIIPIVVHFTRKHNHSTPIEAPHSSPLSSPPSQWLNLTGYPPMPTGISTVVQPEAVTEQPGCVEPATAWSCAVPKEQFDDIKPNKPNQPNLKWEILFQNGTVPDASKTRPLRRAANPVSAGAFIRSRFLNIRAAPSASPAPPSIEDRKFLGQVTEKVSAPFEGEDTPFFISLQNAKASPPPRLLRRDDDDPNNITGIIPAPTLNADGTAAPANLLPYVSAQPLRLFNRGKDDEYYGFYTYFDRTIFLKTIEDDFGRGGNPSDTDGGSSRDAAKMRCTYSQTRFFVQIWTRSQATKPIVSVPVALNSSDTTLRRPGTFPYPVTVTLDRHGGNAGKKMLYCYSMENDTTIIDKSENKFFIAEDRSFGGTLTNGTNGLTNITTPIDGGTGGCSCKWQNWHS